MRHLRVIAALVFVLASGAVPSSALAQRAPPLEAECRSRDLDINRLTACADWIANRAAELRRDQPANDGGNTFGDRWTRFSDHPENQSAAVLNRLVSDMAVAKRAAATELQEVKQGLVTLELLERQLETAQTISVQEKGIASDRLNKARQDLTTASGNANAELAQIEELSRSIADQKESGSNHSEPGMVQLAVISFVSALFGGLLAMLLWWGASKWRAPKVKSGQRSRSLQGPPIHERLSPERLASGAPPSEFVSEIPAFVDSIMQALPRFRESPPPDEVAELRLAMIDALTELANYQKKMLEDAIASLREQHERDLDKLRRELTEKYDNVAQTHHAVGEDAGPAPTLAKQEPEQWPVASEAPHSATEVTEEYFQDPPATALYPPIPIKPSYAADSPLSGFSVSSPTPAAPADDLMKAVEWLYDTLRLDRPESLDDLIARKGRELAETPGLVSTGKPLRADPEGQRIAAVLVLASEQFRAGSDVLRQDLRAHFAEFVRSSSSGYELIWPDRGEIRKDEQHAGEGRRGERIQGVRHPGLSRGSTVLMRAEAIID